MYKVYVAGKLNAIACDYIQNVHRMIKWARKIRATGFAVYVPAIDLLEGLVDGHFQYEDYFNNSQPWLMAADAVFLVPGWQSSKGTKEEIETAKMCGIPVFDELPKMIRYFSDGV